MYHSNAHIYVAHIYTHTRTLVFHRPPTPSQRLTASCHHDDDDDDDDGDDDDDADADDDDGAADDVDGDDCDDDGDGDNDDDVVRVSNPETSGLGNLA